MIMEVVSLDLPLTDETLQSLRIGQAVSLNGVVFTCRTQFHVRVLEQELLPPVDFCRVNVMCHMGPVMRPSEVTADGWEPLCIGGTTSMRFEKYAPDIIAKLGLRAIVGKGTMGPGTVAAMKRLGCVHLCSVGLYAKVLAQRVKRVIAVYGLEELGMIEATWVLEVEDFGPFIVDIDALGNSLFDQIQEGIATRAREVYAHFGLSRAN
jgi:tartrate/fumarate subfamily iron-sulfur-dependent hydro-lyase beta chain